MAVHSGRTGRVLLSTTGSGTAELVVSLNEWTLNRTTDRIEVTAFGDANKTYVQGLPDLSGTFGGFWNDAEAKLFTAAQSSDGAKLYLYPDFANNPGSYAYGPAWVDASITTGVAAAVGINGTFAANGSWGTVAL